MRPRIERHLVLGLTLVVMACGREQPFGGELAAVTDSVFAGTARHCLDSSNSECWGKRRDTTAYYYLNPGHAVLVLGRQWQVATDSVTESYDRLATILDRRFGKSTTCARSDSASIPLFRTWRVGDLGAAAIVVRPNDATSSFRTLRFVLTTEAYVCSQLFSVPLRL
jgi:hypothetical protein